MADVRDMFMVHTMMRREFELLPQLVRDVASGDTKRSAVVAAHAERISRVLHLHHEGEDIVLWPLLLERGGAQASAIVPTMEEQHHGIEAALHDVETLLPVWKSTAQNGANLAAAFEVLLDRLLKHMVLEEEEILPLAEKVVTAAEWAQLGEHSLSNSSKKDLPLVLGMTMYEGDPEVVEEVLSRAPLMVRLIMPLVAPRLYASHAKRIYGTATPPRVGRR
ncbi:hemerythrin domain-containing protein [Streptosporangium sp. NPDC023963]|uniref:hemerythrin domain-containing protein n=1 Tax=Streptosporangium sp. NPDC023963 TaxID=3155608 RepID=UPI0034485062